MKHYLALLLACALIFNAPASTYAQTPADIDQQDDERVTVGSSEVLLDVVIRDKKGRPVRDLTAADFDIYEDGVRQQPTSFKLISGTPSRTPTTTTTTTNATPAARDNAPTRPTALPFGAATLGAVAIVFDRLTPDARARAFRAALSYANGESGANDYVGVFGVDLSLSIIQPFTNDLQLVRQALGQAGGRGSAAFNSDAGQARTLNERQAGLDASAAAAQSAIAGAAAGPGNSAAASAGAADLGASVAQQQLNAMQTRILETFESLARDQQGYATTNGLLAVVNAMRPLPGRKAIIFFSEGLSIPQAVQSHFRAVISNANRANVSIYAVDAAGLRVESTTAEAQRELTTLANSRIRQTATGREDTSGQPLSRLLERGENLLRLNPHSGLGQLADETGGFLISDSNDPGGRLRQVGEDLHTYYALTYAPTNHNYDGRFREISVKLKRTGLDVQTRQGYFAINANYASPVLAYEAPALAALGASRAAATTTSFPVLAGGFDFPAPDGGPAHAAVIVEVPAGSYTFATDKEKQSYHTDFSVVALLRDETGQVIKKLSNQYQLTGALDSLAAAKRDAVLFYREANLEPGRYALNVAVYDALAERSSVVRARLEVPSADEMKLRLGSVVLVKRVEQLAAAQQPLNPFHFGEALIYPLLNEPLRKSVVKELNFFLTAYAARGAKTAPKVTLELMREGRMVGRTPLTLPAPDAHGRMQYASALPLERLAPGDYALRIVADGGGAVTREAHFVVAP